MAGRIRSYVCGFFVLSFHGPADSCNHTDTDRNKRVRPVLPLLTPVPTCCRCHSGTHFRLSWCSPTRSLRFASLCSRLNRAVGPAFFAHQLLFLCVCCFCDVFSSMKTHVCFNARRTAYAHWLPCSMAPAPAVHFDVTFKNPFDAKHKGCGPVRVGAHISTDVEFIAVILPTSTLRPLFLKSQRRAVTQFHTRSASSAVAAFPTPTTMRFGSGQYIGLISQSTGYGSTFR